MGASPTALASAATSAEGIKAPAVGSSTASPASAAESVSTLARSSCSAAPYGNGTAPLTKPSYGTGTGFLTLAKPIETMSAH
jgi:hypothetical protein